MSPAAPPRRRPCPALQPLLVDDLADQWALDQARRHALACAMSAGASATAPTERVEARP